jgi:hypothetical protein
MVDRNHVCADKREVLILIAKQVPLQKSTKLGEDKSVKTLMAPALTACIIEAFQISATSYIINHSARWVQAKPPKCASENNRIDRHQTFATFGALLDAISHVSRQKNRIQQRTRKICSEKWHRLLTTWDNIASQRRQFNSGSRTKLRPPWATTRVLSKSSPCALHVFAQLDLVWSRWAERRCD